MLAKLGVAATLALALSTQALRAGEPDRNKAWDALIAEAKRRGGAETVLDRTSSYIFQQQDGNYVSLTRVLKTGKRAVCSIAKAEDFTLCVDWDTRRATLGSRADNASPWVNVEYESLDMVPTPTPAVHVIGMLESLLKRTRHASKPFSSY